MWVICGLGNPGLQYERTRHNAGFLAIDEMVGRFHLPRARKRFSAETTEGRVGDHDVLLMKPQTFMNLSGQAVGEALRFYKVEPANLLVIHDEVDLPFGKVRLKMGGGMAGHNGLKSIVAHVGTQNFARVRIGVGRSPSGGELVHWVLAPFGQEERDQLPAVVSQAVDGIEMSLRDGLERAMNRFNSL